MKIRTSFVSNSSSSSFIIFTPEVDDSKLNLLRDKLADIEDNGEYEEWGDSGNTWKEEGNFIFIETYYLDNDWWDFWKKLNIPKEYYADSSDW